MDSIKELDGRLFKAEEALKIAAEVVYSPGFGSLPALLQERFEDRLEAASAALADIMAEIEVVTAPS